MSKNLSEMSNEELWRLFPIYLTEHKKWWENWFDEESKLLFRVIPDRTLHRISHIGSTALETIWAKPIVDILVEANETCNLCSIKEILLKNGYLMMFEEAKRFSFNKGYTENGFAEKVFHLHLRYAGDNDELYFRDYLRDNPDVAKEYEQLKLYLWKQYEHNRDDYTQAKTDFVKKYTKLAKEKYAEI